MNGEGFAYFTWQVLMYGDSDYGPCDAGCWICVQDWNWLQGRRK